MHTLIIENIHTSISMIGTNAITIRNEMIGSCFKSHYIDLYQAHRYDYETPLEETMQAFADVVRRGQALYIGVSEWSAEEIRDGHALATDLGFQLVSNQPQYSMLWRVIEPEVEPACRELGISQVVSNKTKPSRS